MNAGMGIVHSERPPKDIHQHGGEQEIVQLWVNSPAKNKMDQPSYHSLSAEATPVIAIRNAKVNVISGELDGVKGGIPSFSPVNTFTADFKTGGRYRFNVPDNHNAFVYLLSGKLNVNATADMEQHYLFAFNNDGDGFEVEALEDSIFLVATGEPLNEPVSSHGPFVMNNQTQIMEAFRDYQMGKMGVLIEEG